MRRCEQKLPSGKGGTVHVAAFLCDKPRALAMEIVCHNKDGRTGRGQKFSAEAQIFHGVGRGILHLNSRRINSQEEQPISYCGGLRFIFPSALPARADYFYLRVSGEILRRSINPCLQGE